jgi:hypothetical protein
MWFLGELVCGWRVRWIANSSWPEGTGTGSTITVVDSGAEALPSSPHDRYHPELN